VSKIFISYCTRDADAWDIIRNTRDRLEADGYEVFLDALVLRPGDEWRPRLNQELAECRVAIIFLSEQALQSSWVRREIEILLWRRALRSPVSIIPVLLGGLRSDKVVQAGFTELRSLQYASVSYDDTTDETVEKIVARLAGLPVDVPGDDKMADWIERISEHLTEAHGTHYLRKAAIALGVPDGDVPTVMLPVDGGRFFAYQMLGCGRSSKLEAAVAALAVKLTSERLARLIDEVRATWVNPAAARLVLQLPDDAGHTLFLLNANEQDTGKLYVDRAYCCALTGFGRESAGGIVGEEGELGLPPQYEKALGELYCWTPSFPRTEPEGDGCYYLAIKPEPYKFKETLAAIRRMQEKFPRLVVILLTGTDGLAGDGMAESGIDDCLPLEPGLAEGDEQHGLWVGSQLDALCNRASGWRYRSSGEPRMGRETAS
jgi:TIR domain